MDAQDTRRKRKGFSQNESYQRPDLYKTENRALMPANEPSYQQTRLS
jgi:hypothetical protein